MKRYKINLSKQIRYLEAEKTLPCLKTDGSKDKRPLYFNVRIRRDKRVRGGLRDVLVLSFSEGTKGVYYKVNTNGSVELPRTLIQKITNGKDGKVIYSMISAIDDKGQKILVPWLDNKGNF